MASRYKPVDFHYTLRMDRTLTAVPVHFDGETITLESNARLLVTILDPEATPDDLVYSMMSTSAVSLARIWDNDEDAVYDSY